MKDPLLEQVLELVQEQVPERSTKPTLLYVYDPMCSWCWGYHPTWQQLQAALKKQFSSTLTIRYCLGGLAPDSNEPMPQTMQNMLQQTWHKISKQLGTEFNFDFWQQCQPKRSTYPACRAALIARKQGKEQAMILAIQQGYYLNAKNPSEIDTLVELAAAIGFDEKAFKQALLSEEIDQQLMDEITLARKLPINGFPSLVLAIENECFPIQLDYQQWQRSFNDIRMHMPNS